MNSEGELVETILSGTNIAETNASLQRLWSFFFGGGGYIVVWGESGV